MKRLSLVLLILLLTALAAPALADNDQCLMCHQAMEETPVQAHQNCMVCHQDGAEEHLSNPRAKPEPVSDETCAMCHQPNDDFKAISAHTMGMECANCHLIHDE
ncbi:hypothetical protein [Wenzhouxiangella limi]|uniref:Tetrahaem cytochrome domain-containing protein n=1 Tax=Wenzhouxiangella limi TaxID=2707351 RepID=A0A845V266_9GAMM|nr:hypothetical protein [Wenzhouxiangella limi]NDY96804.1 hypothetical protein [Wenzhouxiangella limi]